MTSSLSHVTALVLVYRRVVTVWGLPPLLTIVTPRVVQLCWYSLNILTAGQALWTLTLWIGLILTCWWSIRFLTENDKLAYEKALLANRRHVGKLLVASAFSARFLPLPSASLLSSSMPYVSFSQSFRVAAVLACLGAAVVGRFLGPQSIVRCSTVPLATSRNSWRNLWEHPLVFMAGEMSGELWATSSSRNYRRWQRPSFSALVAQACIAVGVGLILAVLGVPQNDGGLAVVVVLAWSVLGASYELQPQPTLPTMRFWLIRQVLPVTLVASILSLLSTSLWQRSTIIPSVATSLAMSLYVFGFDHVLRYRLFCPRPFLPALVSELVGPEENNLSFETVWVQSLLRSTAISQQVLLNHQCDIVPLSRDWAARLLHPQPDDPPSENQLEKDILQLAVLESKPPKHSDAAYRALCVYVRGLGEALLLCTHSKMRWTLPPGLLRAAECAVRGLGTMYDYDDEPLPLECIFVLRQALGELFGTQFPPGQSMGVHAPEWLQVVRACDDAAKSMTAAVTRRRPLAPHLRDWTQRLGQ